MPRAARVVVPKVLHHVTERGNHRAKVFFDDEDRYFFLEQLVHYTMQARVLIVSYCLMTNHTHLLLIPSDETGLAKALKPLPMRYSQHLNYRFNRTEKQGVPGVEAPGGKIGEISAPNTFDQPISDP
jgi:putative transposase